MGGQPGQMYPMSQQEHTNFMDPTQLPASAMAVRNFEPATNPMTGDMPKPMAAGGDTSKKGKKPSYTNAASLATMSPWEASKAKLNTMLKITNLPAYLMSNYKKYLKDGGYIAFHDINYLSSTISSGCEVHKLWNELKSEYKYFEFNHSNKPSTKLNRTRLVLHKDINKKFEVFKSSNIDENFMKPEQFNEKEFLDWFNKLSSL